MSASEISIRKNRPGNVCDYLV